MTAVPPWKKIVLEQLGLLASEAEQVEYEAKVPHVDIARELVEDWFSDSYHPNDVAFTACFSEAEREVLRDFNRQFDAALALLPASNGTVRNWLRSPEWRGAMAHAAQARQKIAG
jgi:hypothetical protein